MVIGVSEREEQNMVIGVSEREEQNVVIGSVKVRSKTWLWWSVKGGKHVPVKRGSKTHLLGSLNMVKGRSKTC